MGVKLGLLHHRNVREWVGDEIVLTKEVEHNRKKDKIANFGTS
jgi:hypothetical protein